MFSRRSILRGGALALGAPMINRGRFSLFAQSKTEYSVRSVDLVRRSTVIDMLGLLTLEAQPDRFREVDFLRLRDSETTVFHPAVGFVEGDIYTQTLADVVRWRAFIAAHHEQFHRIEMDQEKLSDPAFYLSGHEDELVIIDEVQRMPDPFATLRGLIDQGRRRGKTSGRFLLLGSASSELLRQSETLAGRIAYIELTPFDVLEVAAGRLTNLWARGGFPESFLAGTDSRSLIWRQDFIHTYLERDIPQLGPRIPATTLRRFWTMLAHVQKGCSTPRSLPGVSPSTARRSRDISI